MGGEGLEGDFCLGTQKLTVDVMQERRFPLSVGADYRSCGPPFSLCLPEPLQVRI